MTPNETTFEPYHVWLQIPKSNRPPTHFQLLGLRPGESDADVIRQATLMRSAYVRHFQNGPNAADANRILEELAEASRVLLDPEQRVAYEAKVKPAKSAPKPTAAANKLVLVEAPKAEVVDPEPMGKGTRRLKKSRRSRSQAKSFAIFGLVLVGVAVGVVVGLSRLYKPGRADAASKSIEVDADGKQEAATLAASSPGAAKSATFRPLDPQTVRVSVNPPDAQLALEPIGGNAADKLKASLEGAGAERTIVAEKGALPLVVAASALGYQSNRVTVFSSDAGRLVVVQLQKDGTAEMARAAASPSRRQVGEYQVGIPLSSKAEKPVWKYTTDRPGPGWTADGFNDSAWSEGKGSFGTAAGMVGAKPADVLLRTTWTTPDIWLRTKVVLPPQIKDAKVRWTYRHDEGMQVYVNTVLQFREPGYSWGVHTRTLDAANFRAGENIIAIHCHNNGGPGLIDVGFEWVPTEPVP